MSVPLFTYDKLLMEEQEKTKEKLKILNKILRGELRPPRRQAGSPYNLLQLGGLGGASGSFDISFVAIGTSTGAISGTPINIPFPSGIAATQGLLIFVWGYAGDSSGIGSIATTPAGWTLVGEFHTYDPFNLGAQYSARLTIFFKEATGSETGTVTVTMSQANTNIGIMTSYSKTGGSWLFSSVFGAAIPNSSAINATASSDPGIQAKDVLITFGQTYNTSGWSLETLTAPGITFGSTTDRFDNPSFPNIVIDDAIATAGTSSGSPNLVATSGSGVGGVAFFRIRAS